MQVLQVAVAVSASQLHSAQLAGHTANTSHTCTIKNVKC